MTLSSSREAIGNALVALLQGIQDPVTSQPIYALVKLGMIYDPQSTSAWAAIWHWQGKTDYAGSGGNQIGWRADDEVMFVVTTGAGPYELDSTAAEQTKLHIMDIVPPTLRQHFQLPDASNPTNAIASVYSTLLNNVDKTEKPQKFADGHVYALWHLFVTVKQQFNIQLVQP